MVLITLAEIPRSARNDMITLTFPDMNTSGNAPVACQSEQGLFAKLIRHRMELHLFEKRFQPLDIRRAARQIRHGLKAPDVTLQAYHADIAEDDLPLVRESLP